MSKKRQISSVVSTLVRAADDPSQKVKNTIQESLTTIGRFEPELVLITCKEALEEKGKNLKQSHRIALLKVMRMVVVEKLDLISEDLGDKLAVIGMAEMLAEKSEVIPEWQEEASKLLVSVGMKYAKKIVTSLLGEFGAGAVPHLFVMKTLADLATDNPVDMVPLLSDVLSRMLPVLASIKQDNIRWVFGVAIGTFCEAINSYKANVNTFGLDVSVFAPQIYACFELIVANWLQSKSAKVRLVTIQAIGACTTVMATNSFEGQLPKLIMMFNKQYQQEKVEDHLSITQGYCNLLGTATRSSSIPVLEPLLESVLNTFFPLICNPIDYGEPSALKNHNEMLRSVEICAKQFIDTVLTYLFTKLRLGNASVKNGVLLIIKHLVTRNVASGLQLENRKELLVSSLKPIVDKETDLQCKKSLAQVIVSMANEAYLNLEGGDYLVEFIILNSSISDAEIKKWQEATKGQRNPGVSPSELRGMCDHILSLMTTTIPHMVDVLWPYLLEPLTKTKFNSSMAVVAKCISHISKVKRESNAPNYMINFDKMVNLPKPPQILARLFVLSNLPSRRGNLAHHLLTTLQYIGPILHPAPVAMWDTTIPKLLGFLKSDQLGSADDNDSKWEGLVRRLLSETIKQINDDTWAMALGDALVDQFPLSKGDPVVRRCALKLLGVVLQHVTHKEYIKTTLATIHKNTSASDENELLGMAQGFGYAASSHLDLVLEFQSNTITGPGKKEPVKEESDGGGLFSWFSSGPSPAKTPSPGSVASTILAYGYITAYAKPALITSRLDMHIICHLATHLKTTNVALQQTMIKVIDLIAQTVHPEHLLTDAYVFKHRDEYLRSVLSYIALVAKDSKKKDEKAPTKLTAKRELQTKPFPTAELKLKTCVLGLNACATLLKLLPAVPRDIEDDIIFTVAQMMTIEKEDKKKEKDSKEAPPVEEVKLELIFENVERVFHGLLQQDRSIGCLKRMAHSLNKFLASPVPLHRKRALVLHVSLLKKYIEILREMLAKNEKPGDREIEGLGKLVSYMIPRCCDPEAEIRGASIEIVQLTLYIHWCLNKILVESNTKPLDQIEINPPKSLSPFTGLRKRMVAIEDQNEQFGLAHSMATLLGQCITELEIPHLLMGATRGLLDSTVPGARGTCVIIFGIVGERGKDLKGKSESFVTELINKMKHIKNDQTLNGTLHAVRTMAKINMDASLEALLKQPVPHEPHVVKVSQLFARDPELLGNVVTSLMDILNNGDILEDPSGGAGGEKAEGDKKPADKKQIKGQVPTAESCAATVTLSEILTEEEVSEFAVANLSKLAGTLLLRVGVTAGHAVAAEQNIQCWKNLFTVVQEEDIVEKMTEAGVWEKASKLDSHIVAVTALTSIFSRRHIAEMDKLFAFMLNYLKANYTCQRLVTGFCFSELVVHIGTNAALLDKLVTNLLNSLVDPVLKIPALRGLGNVSLCPVELANQYAPTILDALMSAIDDNQDDIALEAMNGLAKAFGVVDESRIAPILINIFHRIRPAFENTNDKIRSASAHLFESLARYGRGKNKDAIYDQIHTNLPAIMVHINDENDDVKKSFRKTLSVVAPLLNDAGIDSILSQKHIFQVENETDYTDFLHMHMSKALIKAFPNQLNNYVQTLVTPYFESQWDVIKANAAYFIGCILGHLPEEMRKDVGINVGHTTKALISLLASKSPLVRQRVAEAMSMLHTY